MHQEEKPPFNIGKFWERYQAIIIVVVMLSFSGLKDMVAPGLTELMSVQSGQACIISEQKEMIDKHSDAIGELKINNAVIRSEMTGIKEVATDTKQLVNEFDKKLNRLLMERRER